MCEFHCSNGNGLGDIWWTDKFIYFSIIDVLYLTLILHCLRLILIFYLHFNLSNFCIVIVLYSAMSNDALGIAQ